MPHLFQYNSSPKRKKPGFPGFFLFFAIHYFFPVLGLFSVCEIFEKEGEKEKEKENR